MSIVRLYPTSGQRRFLNGQFGAVRFCYNKAVALKGDLYRKKGISQYDSISLQEAVRHANTGFKRFFKKEARFPKFKSKRNRQSSYHCSSLTVGEGFIKTPKCEPIKEAIHQSIQGKRKSINVFRDRMGDSYVSILSETPKKIPDKPTELEESKVIGIELGIKDFLTDSFNRTVDKSKELNSALKKLKKAHKEVSHKEKEAEGEARRSDAS